MIKPIKKTNISEEVFLQMKQLIIDRKWKPGDKLPSESELCKLFDVSRVTVRNALQRLAALDLIKTRPGDGAYIKMVDDTASFNRLVPIAYFEENIDIILEFRREIESGTCAIAVEKADENDIKELRTLLKQMEGLQDDLEQLAIADLDFHYKIAQISRNPLIIKTYEIIADIYNSHMKHMVKKMGGEYGMYYHKKIVDAIEARDAEKARDYMREHIDKNQDFIKGIKIN
ncbi:MAG TPA: FadR family transcriptional regulator [Eubacteriaceae bacterium]|nr:FadR family transcriptional regulator [Eubacteriaceae bacterium]